MSIAEISLQLWDGPRALFLSHQAFRTPVTTTPGAFLTSFAFFSAGTIWQSKFDLRHLPKTAVEFRSRSAIYLLLLSSKSFVETSVVTAYRRLIRVREGKQF